MFLTCPGQILSIILPHQSFIDKILAFTVDQCMIFHLVELGKKWKLNELQCFNSLPNDNNEINVTEKLKYVLGRVENMMRKGENAGYQHF